MAQEGKEFYLKENDKERLRDLNKMRGKYTVWKAQTQREPRLQERPGALLSGRAWW